MSPRRAATSRSSSTIWTASSRVGARTRAAGLRSAGLEQVGDGHAEGEGLARAGRRLDEDVAPGEDVGDDQLLDCERRDDAAPFERVRDRTRNAEIGERHVVQLLYEWWES